MSIPVCVHGSSCIAESQTEALFPTAHKCVCWIYLPRFVREHVTITENDMSGQVSGQGVTKRAETWPVTSQVETPVNFAVLFEYPVVLFLVPCCLQGSDLLFPPPSNIIESSLSHFVNCHQMGSLCLSRKPLPRSANVKCRNVYISYGFISYLGG